MKTLVKLVLGAALLLAVLPPLSTPSGPFPQPDCPSGPQTCPSEIPQ
jgi:hypothetical protein